MSSDFSRCLSLLRQEKGISSARPQRILGISQALLSHYENGVREPGLAFVTKACNYYNVVGGFLLGRTLSRTAPPSPPKSCTITPPRRTTCSTAPLWPR